MPSDAEQVAYRRVRFGFLNIGHFLDHFFILIFATAALRLTIEWGLDYAELIPYATTGFVAFGVGAIPAGYLADKWSREAMLGLFFIGIGASSLLAGVTHSPFQMAVALTLLGLFAAIYHPVGLAMVVEGGGKTGLPIAINGVFGNMGVASAALVTGLLVDNFGWRVAFLLPGAFAIAIGGLYILWLRMHPMSVQLQRSSSMAKTQGPMLSQRLIVRVFGVILMTSALGGLVFQATTFTLPKVFEEYLGEIATTTTSVGWYAFLVFTLASMAQLLVGHLLDRYALRTVFAVVAFLQAVLFALMALVEGVMALPLALAFMLVVFGQIPINDVLIGRVARGGWRSRAFALRSIVSFSVMAATLPLISWFYGNWGFSMLFASLAGAAILILIASLRLPDGAKLSPDGAH